MIDLGTNRTIDSYKLKSDSKDLGSFFTTKTQVG